MDYIDYALNQYYEDERTSDEMTKLGFTDYSEYQDYKANTTENY